MKRNACQKCEFAVYDDNPHCGLRGFTSNFNVEWCSAENDKVPNGYELQEDGYFSWVKKKKEYPKTYEECCGVLGMTFDYPDIRMVSTEEFNLYSKFIQLKRCRDAYWKIAGEEMGFGKPWEPDFSSHEEKFSISVFDRRVVCIVNQYDNIILTFPTREMRDAFYENFKELIEQCKELL